MIKTGGDDKMSVESWWEMVGGGKKLVKIA